jgi:hypothetical protein
MFLEVGCRGSGNADRVMVGPCKVNGLTLACAQSCVRRFCTTIGAPCSCVFLGVVSCLNGFLGVAGGMGKVHAFIEAAFLGCLV